MQLTITFGLVLLLGFNHGIRIYLRYNKWIFGIASAVLFAALFAVRFFEFVRRSYPLNLIVLGIITLAKATVIGYLSSKYNPELVTNLNLYSFVKLH